MKEPGLISREFYKQGYAEFVREEWDLTVPGCPMIAIDHSKWSSGELGIDKRVKTVTRIVRIA